MSTPTITITMDTTDVERAAKFWAAVTGFSATVSEGHATLAPAEGRGPSLAVQQVAERAPGKNPVHLDLAVGDLDSEVAQALALGAGEVRRFDGDDGRWVVLTDPDGNQFCLVAQ